jgi:hypothetical protein
MDGIINASFSKQSNIVSICPGLTLNFLSNTLNTPVYASSFSSQICNHLNNYTTIYQALIHNEHVGSNTDSDSKESTIVEILLISI